MTGSVFRGADFGFFSDLVGKILWEAVLKCKGTLDSWLIFRYKLKAE